MIFRHKMYSVCWRHRRCVVVDVVCRVLTSTLCCCCCRRRCVLMLMLSLSSSNFVASVLFDIHSTFCRVWHVSTPCLCHVRVFLMTFGVWELYSVRRVLCRCVCFCCYRRRNYVLMSSLYSCWHRVLSSSSMCVVVIIVCWCCRCRRRTLSRLSCLICILLFYRVWRESISLISKKLKFIQIT